MGKSLTLHTGGNWAGAMPSFSDLEHECAEDLNSYLYDVVRDRRDLGARRARRPGRRGRRLPDQEPDAARLLRRNVPLTRHGLRRLQLRPGLQGQPGHRRHVRGLPHPRLHRQVQPDRGRQLHGLQRRPGRRDRLRQHPDPLVGRARRARPRRAPASSSARASRASTSSTSPTRPSRRSSSSSASPRGQRGRRLVGCGSHTATAVPDPARDASTSTTAARAAPATASTSSGSSISDPTDDVIGCAQRGIDADRRAPGNSCHDNNVLLNVGGTYRPATPCARAATASPCTSST